MEIFVAPEGPIKEKDCTNVTMQCKVDVGNPEELEQVLFLDLCCYHLIITIVWN